MKPVTTVLSVQHYPVFGGPHNEIIRLEPTFARSGIRTVVAHTDQSGNAVERLKDARVAVETLPLHRIRLTSNPLTHLSTALHSYGDIQRLRSLIRAHDVDIVKVHGPHNPQGAIAAHLEGVPVVWVVSSTRVPRGFRTLGGHLVKGLANVILTNGEQTISAYPPLEDCREKLVVYYPPVDTNVFQPSPEIRQAARIKLAIPDDAPVVGMVANLNPQKGIEYFIRAAASIKRRMPSARFIVIGSSYASHRDYIARLEREMKDLGLEITFTGHRTDLQELYLAMDVKLITSIPASEGTTTTAIEAMACGVPVVTTKVGAVHEVVEDEITGFTVPPLQPEAIADATLRLLENADLRHRMGTAARQRAVERFDTEVCADAYLKAYEMATGHHYRRRALELNQQRSA